MKILSKPISIFGILYLLLGIFFNINMHVTNAWPTYMFLILMLVGIIYILIGWKTNLGMITQIILVILPVIIYYLLRFFYSGM